jgi:hypothetical protein
LLGHVVPHCVNVVPQFPTHVTWFVEVHPPGHEQLLETLVGW